MSDTQEADSQVETQETQNEAHSKPAGYDPVDLSNLAPEIREPIEKRFSYLYGQVKNNERNLHQYKSIAQQQSEKLEELMGNFGTVVDHLYSKEQGQTEASIRQEIKAAYDSGDAEKYQAAQEKLMEFKVDQKLKAKPEKTEKPKTQEINKQPTVAELRAEALGDGDWTQEDDTYLESWQNETSNGVDLRPWAKEGHRLYPYAFNEAMLVFSSPAYERLTTEQKLAEVDRRMGVSKSGGQTVMGGSLTTRGKSSKITLTPKQQEIAVRTKFGGSKAKSDAEHIEAYKKQIETLNRKSR